MASVLHYKTKFLNSSETFIHRLVSNHKRYDPLALCYIKKDFSSDIPVYQAPKSSLNGLVNSASFHLNRSLPFYRSTIQKLRPDVIHSHFGYDAYKLLDIAHSEKIPHVVSFYGSDVSRLPLEFGWKSRYKKMAAQASHFIAASVFMKKQLIDLGFPSEKISVIYFGLDLEALTFQEKSFGDLNILMAGRLVEKKGFEYALKAISMLKLRGIEIPITLFGDGPLMHSLKKLASDSGIENQVHFRGFQPVSEILKAHSNHSLFLAPSVTASDGDMEGLPNTILEAMAKGTPVIATEHAAIPEALTHQESGFLVEERNSIAIANCIEKVIRKRHQLIEVAKNARIKVEKSFTIQNMVQQVEKIYDLARSQFER